MFSFSYSSYGELLFKYDNVTFNFDRYEGLFFTMIFRGFLLPKDFEKYSSELEKIINKIDIDASEPYDVSIESFLLLSEALPFGRTKRKLKISSYSGEETYFSLHKQDLLLSAGRNKKNFK